MAQLTTGQRQHLRRLAHDLRPLIQIGKQGVTPGALHSIDEALGANELIKIKFADFQDEKTELSQMIADETRSELVGIVGNVATLYRVNPDPEKRRISLP
jgi:RNA-binding protein